MKQQRCGIFLGTWVSMNSKVQRTETTNHQKKSQNATGMMQITVLCSP